MFWTLMRRAALSVITVAAAMVLIPPGTAHADTVDYPMRIDAVRGEYRRAQRHHLVVDGHQPQTPPF